MGEVYTRLKSQTLQRPPRHVREALLRVLLLGALGPCALLAPLVAVVVVTTPLRTQAKLTENCVQHIDDTPQGNDGTLLNLTATQNYAPKEGKGNERRRLTHVRFTQDRRLALCLSAFQSLSI